MRFLLDVGDDKIHLVEIKLCSCASLVGISHAVGGQLTGMININPRNLDWVEDKWTPIITVPPCMKALGGGNVDTKGALVLLLGRHGCVAALGGIIVKLSLLAVGAERTKNILATKVGFYSPLVKKHSSSLEELAVRGKATASREELKTVLCESILVTPVAVLGVNVIPRRVAALDFVNKTISEPVFLSIVLCKGL